MENFTPEMHNFLKNRFIWSSKLKNGLLSRFKIEKHGFKTLRELKSDELTLAYLKYHKAVAHLYATAKKENYKMFSDYMISSFLLPFENFPDFADEICQAMRNAEEA